MINFKSGLILLYLFSMFACDGKQSHLESNLQDLMIRIAEIEVDSNHIEDYVNILKEEASAAIRLEPGVICIYPMFQKENPTKIRLLEIYADENAYQSHLQTPHFVNYKSNTLHMVKSLKLIEMESIDAETMSSIFVKLEEQLR